MHSWSHVKATTLTNDQLVAEYVWTARAIYQVVGKVPRYIRPPGGDMDRRTKAVIKAMGLVPILWNHDSYDYLINAKKGRDSLEKMVADVQGWLSAPNDNGIISSHRDTLKISPDALINVLKVVSTGDFSLVKMSECLSFYPHLVPYQTKGKFYDLVAQSPRVPDAPPRFVSTAIPTIRPSPTRVIVTVSSTQQTGSVVTETNLPEPTRLVPIRRNDSGMGPRPSITLLALVVSSILLMMI